jgi:hypothetical protein
MSGAGLRQMMISEYTAWLRSATNKHGRPFQEGTVRDYTETARVLNRWMTEQDHDGDFTACDDALLNTFFRRLLRRARAERHQHPPAQPAASVHLAGKGL